jgi:hypothetical protein
MRMFLLPVLAIGLLGSAARGFAQDDPRAVLEQALKAHGGEDRLLRFKAAHSKVKGTLYLDQEIPFRQEVYSQLPGQMKDILEFEEKGKAQSVITALNVDKGWMTVNGKPQPLADNALADLKEAANLMRATRLISLKDTLFELRLLGESSVSGRPAVGLLATAKGYRDLRLFFDREHGILVKVERRVINAALKEVVEERFLSEYREVEGILAPKKAVILRDGKKFLEAEVTEAQFLEKLDDKVFEKPNP